jgi:hypothetical protein
MHSGYDPTIYPPRLTSRFFLINNDFSVKITIFELEMKKGHLWYILYIYKKNLMLSFLILKYLSFLDNNHIRITCHIRGMF